MIVLGAFSRLIPHPANFAPIAALALFGGANFKKGWEYIIPIAAMLLSDIFLGFHSTMLYVYGSFFLIILIGKLLENKKTAPYIFSASLISSVLFFLVTNFGVWASTTMYVKNFSGLMNAYAMGIPFFRNTLLGDLFYTFSFFYGFRYFDLWAKKLHFARSS